MKKKGISIVLAGAMAFMAISPVFADEKPTAKFVDLPGHWGEVYMLAAVDNGLMQGVSEDRILPGSPLTRAELAAIVNRAFGSTKKADITRFTDVPAKEWYADEIAKSLEMGIINGDTDTTANPLGHVTREEAFAIVSRAFGISIENTTVLDRFKDKNELADYAIKPTAAMVAFGYAKGDLGKINPQGEMTRAEFAAIMYRLVSGYNEITDGTIMINKPDVSFENVKIMGDVVIGDGAGGTINLNSCEINGRILVRASSNITINLRNAKLHSKVIIMNDKVKVNVNY
ncbi:hypothetical protein FACS189425_01380 [Clostridia bacterium]|nr:hypothetical protein FACS189425_01380 [Clostridia bacterium]